jgi:pimeloyl-ACP methyl ester carboxylesterase
MSFFAQLPPEAPHAERTVPPRRLLHHEPEVVSILGPALEQYRVDAVVESASDAEAFVQHVLPGVVGADDTALERIAGSYSLEGEPEDRHPELFTQPTLHIAGRQDDVVGYADAWDRVEHYPRASFAVLDGAGHNLLFERFALCSILIEDWLARVRGDC